MQQAPEAPKPATAPVEAPQASTGQCDQYAALLSRYDWDVRTAKAIMQAESGCNPSRVGDDYPINGVHAVSCGLFQVRTLRGRPNCDQLKDPTLNIEWAYNLYQARGWQPWTVFNTGAYKKHMR